MTIRYVSSRQAPDTVLMTFRVIHGQRAVIDGDPADDPETGRSPVSRWLAWAFDYDDFISNPDEVGYHCKLIIPRGTIAVECAARVDLAFLAATPGADIDIGDDLVVNGWADSLDWSTAASVVTRDADAVYNNFATDPTKGTAGWQYYEEGDTLDVNWNNATAPTAGRAIVFLKCISYHEDIGAEW